MAGVVASKVRKQRANSNPGQVREQRSEEETFKKRQIKILNAQLQGYSNTEVPRFQVPHLMQTQKEGVSYVILYLGLGVMALGLVVTVVGSGDKGFQTLELKLVGPSLIVCGVLLAILQIVLCNFPALEKLCCDQKDESEQLLPEEDLQESRQMRRKFWRPGRERELSRPVESRVQDKREESVRPIIKSTRVKVANGGFPCRNNSWEESFPFSSLGGDETFTDMRGRDFTRRAQSMSNCETILNSCDLVVQANC